MHRNRSYASTDLGRHPSSPLTVPLLVMALVLVSTSCQGTVGDNRTGDWQAQIDTIGDTVMVQTRSGSDWGRARLEVDLQIGTLDGPDHTIFGNITGLAVGPSGDILVYDRQVPALRRFSAEGQYLGTVGRSGSGPGEYVSSDGGLVVLTDGRIVLRDPGNARLSVYAADGAYLNAWPIRGGRSTSMPMVPALDGGFYNPIFGGGQPVRLVRYAPDGIPMDTLPSPDLGVETATVRAAVGVVSSTWPVPFTQTSLWNLHPGGFFITAMSGQYALYLRHPDGRLLRISKDETPVLVASDERAAAEERVTRAMRRLDPSWRWNGDPIPSTKPILRELHAAEDGRIWVLLHQPGERVPSEERDPDPAGGAPLPQFREVTTFDVFEQDGRYLGRITAPVGFSTSPRPVFRGDMVWALEEDTVGVQRLTRYHIVTEKGSAQTAH